MFRAGGILEMPFGEANPASKLHCYDLKEKRNGPQWTEYDTYIQSVQVGEGWSREISVCAYLFLKFLK
jgi:hypothetical protein